MKKFSPRLAQLELSQQIDGQISSRLSSILLCAGVYVDSVCVAR